MNINMLKDPSFFAENRMAARSDHITYVSEEEEKSGRSIRRVTLNGVWKFAYAENAGQTRSDFADEAVDCRDWQEIIVPAHIQLEGWGKPQYVNTQYPWNAEESILPGQIPVGKNPVGYYVKYFSLPDSMREKRVILRMDGAESCVDVWLNGREIGFSSGSFDAHEFELTEYLKPGENKLALQVFKYSAGSWLEDQDFLRFSGLFRDVVLYAIPKLHLFDLKTETALDDRFRDAVLKLELCLSGEKGKAELKLKERDRVIAGRTEEVKGDRLSVSIPVAAPRLWSAEDPYLYDLELLLTGEDGETEFVRQSIGFRRVEIRESRILINGKRVVFKGVNRHDFCAETGRAVTEEKVFRDLCMMKKNNINAVRTSHYPNSSCLYRLCDELGLYVIDENDMETHGMWGMYRSGLTDRMFPGDYPEWQPMLLDRVRSLCARDRNHPSVIIWSCGNESITGPVILEMANTFRKLDPTRPVHYESDRHAPPEKRLRAVTDIESAMYEPAEKVREYLRTHRDKPYILCEYTHSMGNSNGAMHKYTELAYEEPLYQGGFIWDFIDQSLTEPAGGGREIQRYGGDWDDRPTDGIFSCNGIVFGDGRPTPKLQEIKYNYQDLAILVDKERAVIANRSMFTDTSVYRCVALLERNGETVEKQALPVCIAPGETMEVPLPFGENTVPGEYAVTLSFRLKEDRLWAEAGYEVAFGQGSFIIESTVPNASIVSSLRVTESPWNIGIRGDDFRAVISRSEGLISYAYGGEEYLKRIPEFSFWRTPTDNDNGNAMPQRYAQWKPASLYARNSLTTDTKQLNRERKPIRNADGGISYTLRFDLPTVPAAWCEVTWTAHPDGTLDIRMRYKPVTGLPEPPLFGMQFSLDPTLNRVRYYGLGPEECYTDRCRGARLGRYDYRVVENLTPYARPQECGNRVGVRWAEVTDYRGRGLRFSCRGGEFSALPWTSHELENAAHAEELPPVYRTVARVCMAQMGVGGDDSWGARTHPEYLLPGDRPLDWEFSVKGIIQR